MRLDAPFDLTSSGITGNALGGPGHNTGSFTYDPTAFTTEDPNAIGFDFSETSSGHNPDSGGGGRGTYGFFDPGGNDGPYYYPSTCQGSNTPSPGC